MPSSRACIKNFVLKRLHMNYARIASKLREQIIKFLGELQRALNVLTLMD